MTTWLILFKESEYHEVSLEKNTCLTTNLADFKAIKNRKSHIHYFIKESILIDDPFAMLRNCPSLTGNKMEFHQHVRDTLC